jgi:AcrR family transcriptional regulator
MARIRNRALTEERIISAARSLLLEKGFHNFGINAIARAAKTDKVLLYRYFDSVDGILMRVIAELEFWPKTESLNLSSSHAFLRDTYSHFENNTLVSIFLTHPLERSVKAFAKEQNDGMFRQWKSGFSQQFDVSPPSDMIDLIAHGLWCASQNQLSFPQQVFTLLDSFDSWKVTHQPTEDLQSHFSANEELPTELL